jgi:hypothetical protein
MRNDDFQPTSRTRLMMAVRPQGGEADLCLQGQVRAGIGLAQGRRMPDPDHQANNHVPVTCGWWTGTRSSSHAFAA